MYIRNLVAAVFVATSLAAQQPAVQPSSAPTALTIYNEDFAVARTQIDLDLHSGLNEVVTNQVTTQLEPDSVVLRDPAIRDSSRRPSFRILEQNYDAGVVTQDWLLQKYEGKTIDFQVPSSGLPDGQATTSSIVRGKIVRAPQQEARYPQNSYLQSQFYANQVLVEVDGKLRFQLPGIPLFPASTDGLNLKPTLRWQIDSDKAQKLSAELAYITGGLNWEATYNVVVPNAAEAGSKVSEQKSTSEEKADLTGWVTIHNQSGTEFPQASIKLMAGDISKIKPRNAAYGAMAGNMYQTSESVTVYPGPQVTQKAFDDFHLYDLNRTVSLRDGEIKQIQFIEADGITLSRSYVYDGADAARQPNSQLGNRFVQDRSYGLNSDNIKVSILKEFKNTQANHLGIPLPAGRIRLYRRDSDGQMEFIGESTINHTPTEDTVKISTGSAFDIKGSRRQTDYHIDQNDRILDETFEIKLTNQKSEPVTVNVLEHLYRGSNWEVRQKSADYTKLDSRTIQFPVQVPAKGEASLTYSVRYSW
ncbi:MAG: hypothetical protein ABSD72_15335 [Terracidiphilus sp.]